MFILTQTERRFVIISRKKTEQLQLLNRALMGEATPQVPFWLMRQAGRYLPEYRDLRKTAGSFMDLCFNPEFATEVTLQPIRRFDMDAAILFSDILVVPHALGQELSFVEGEGPQLKPFTSIHPFMEFDADSFDKTLQPIYETVKRVRAGLDAEKSLIGFAGAPWTIACYMVQGHGGDEFTSTKKFAFANPQDMDKLITALVRATAHYLIQQIKHGVDAVQIFDSWAGLLPQEYFERWVTKPTRQIVDIVHKAYPDFPVIGFPRRAGSFYQSYALASGVNAVGLDQFFPVQEAVRDFGRHVALQGNLDPVLLLTGGKALEEGALTVLKAAGHAPFIFNLGHGVIKETPPEHVAQLANIIKNYHR